MASLQPPAIMKMKQPPQEQVVTVHTLPPQPTIRTAYQGGKAKILGWLTIIGGLLSFLFGGLLVWACSLAGVTGAGVWGGIFFLLAGSFGVSAGKSRTSGSITAYLVFALLGIPAALGVIACCAIALALSDSTGSYYCFNYTGFDTRSAVMECLMLIIGFVELIILTWGAVISCKGLCCAPDNPPPQKSSADVQYTKAEKVVIGNDVHDITNHNLSSSYTEQPSHQTGSMAPPSVQTSGYIPDSSFSGSHASYATGQQQPQNNSRAPSHSQQPAYQEGYQPQHGYPSQSYDPSVQPGYDPSAQPGYDPSAQPGYDPSAQQGYAEQGYDYQQGYPEQQGYPQGGDAQGYPQGQQGYPQGQGEYYAQDAQGYAQSPQEAYPPQGQGNEYVAAPEPKPKKKKRSKSKEGSLSSPLGRESDTVI